MFKNNYKEHHPELIGIAVTVKSSSQVQVLALKYLEEREQISKKER